MCYRQTQKAYYQINIFYIYTQFKFHYYCRPSSMELGSGFNNYLTYMNYERFTNGK